MIFSESRLRVDFQKKQKRVLLGIVIGGLGGLSVLLIPMLLDLMPAVDIADFDQRISFGLANCLGLAIAMVIPIMIVAYQRLKNPEAIDGQTDVTGSIEINLRIIQNTLEQTLLAAIAYMAFSCFAPINHLGLLPIVLCWWLFCRLLFAVGYHLGDNARAIGFAGSCLSTLWLLVCDVIYLINW
jgi:hypothetical protein